VKDNPEVSAARADAEHSRSRLMSTAHQLQERLSPKTLARDAWQGAKEKGADVAEGAVDAVRARPLTATGVVAAITLLLVSHPLMNLAGKLTKKSKKSARKPNDTETAT
jgi:ElaB/YqjD/DUF883 family membrane-anchored ribosome-binding protein